MLFFTVIFTVLIALGAQIEIQLPLSPVPVILSDFFVILSALVVGWKWALGGTAFYVLLGIAGLPVFSGGGAGWEHFTGPTGGYLIGFILAAGTVGLISHWKRQIWWRDLIAGGMGFALIFACGVPWLKMVTGLDWTSAYEAGLQPFYVGATTKILAVVLLAGLIRATALQPQSGY